VSASVALRPATPTDLEAICEIEQQVFGHEAWSPDLMRSELEGDHRQYLVLVTGDGTVVGYGGALVVGEQGDVQTIALDPSVRGAGHGRRMMLALLESAERRGANEIFLEVRADNPVARGLYESLGFEQIGVRPRYYQPGDVDALVMRKKVA